jgi:hypothetical protein
MSHSTSTRSRLGCTVSTDPTGTPRICRHITYPRQCAEGRSEVSTRWHDGNRISLPCGVHRHARTPATWRRLELQQAAKDVIVRGYGSNAVRRRTLTGVPTVIPHASGNSNIHCAAQGVVGTHPVSMRMPWPVIGMRRGM